eukprot:CCRYP_017297-RA/>CCRYP_017297-RA protein AED:0.46 eAED:0.12 QI:0/-1/0/1/-1/1/1/0/186
MPPTTCPMTALLHALPSNNAHLLPPPMTALLPASLQGTTTLSTSSLIWKLDSLKYRQLLQHPKFKDAWNTSAANKFGCLVQGVGGWVEGTNTIEFISKSEVPSDRFKDVTYVCSVCTEKKEPNGIRVTMGGNLIHHPKDMGTNTAKRLLIKIFLNSVISTQGAHFISIDLANFYLMTPVNDPNLSR